MPTTEDFETKVQDRFGEIIPEELWGIIPYALYNHQRDLGLTVDHVWFCVYLLNHKWTREWPRVSMTKLCVVSGVSPTTILQYIEDLEEMGYLQREPRDSRGGRPKTFDLSGLLRALAEAVQQAIDAGQLQWLRNEDVDEESIF